ncbi:hypothetical protein GCM10010912_08910 [Paenibacillus albidus]|uniref:NodB homology domain-containing protein n=1 Tax=Paenibacillus albidus TaxID=2041023 RepID=A0A917C0H3_9BACL|nr:polysaccharide deacetylase family protein [Paenibacillus albidus]GGF66070.1 hypothetical protein GCM10010912_08910 [Paenibacillus albidus]
MKRVHLAMMLIALVLCLFAYRGYITASNTVTLNINGHKILGAIPARYTHHEVMIPKELAEQALNVKIGWDRPEPLPEGVYYRDEVAVLMYHHLSEQPMPLFPWVLSVDRFRDQMELLKQEGFHVITMEQYRQFMLDNGSVPDNAVLLTFDDGYESFYSLAFPILQEYGYTAVNFIIVSTIDKPDTLSVPKLTWPQMREMKAAGMGFYNHTYDMHRYGVVDAEGGGRPAASALLYIDDENRNELNEEYYQRVRQDLGTAERRLREELGNTDSAIAFPYGSYNDRLLEITNALGIHLKFNVTEGLGSSLDLNTCRFNGGSELLSAAQTIDQLKRSEPPMVLTVNARRVPLTGVEPRLEEGTLLIPLGRLSKALHLNMDYDLWSHTVKLTGR